MEYRENSEPLGLGKEYKFGIEIEAFNVNTSHNIRNIRRNVSEKFKGIFTSNTKKHDSLYHSRKSIEFFKNTLSSDGKTYKKANRFQESLVGKGGAEIVSPPLHDNETDWGTVEKVCEHIKKYPGVKGKEVIADSKCGLHIHFDSKLLTENPETMRTFLKLWPDMEELVYKMCNDVNDPIRKSTINRSKSILKNFRKIASPIGAKLSKQIENGTLKVSYKNFGFLKRHIIAPLKLDNRRYQGLNLSNIGNPNKNTVEFRMSNGTINPEIIKQNVFLYASIIDTVRNISLGKEFKKEQLESFLRTDITEQEKAKAFTNLIFDNDNDKQIYIKRYESVRNSKIFKNTEKKGFAQNKFTREDMKDIADKVPIRLVNRAIDFITNSRNLIKEGAFERG